MSTIRERLELVTLHKQLLELGFDAEPNAHGEFAILFSFEAAKRLARDQLRSQSAEVFDRMVSETAKDESHPHHGLAALTLERDAERADDIMEQRQAWFAVLTREERERYFGPDWLP